MTSGRGPAACGTHNNQKSLQDEFQIYSIPANLGKAAYQARFISCQMLIGLMEVGCD
jgi:hypothetical protein